MSAGFEGNVFSNRPVIPGYQHQNAPYATFSPYHTYTYPVVHHYPYTSTTYPGTNTFGSSFSSFGRSVPQQYHHLVSSLFYIISSCYCLQHQAFFRFRCPFTTHQ